MFFHKPQPKLENKILDRINLFVNEVNSNSSLSEFIDVFNSWDNCMTRYGARPGHPLANLAALLLPESNFCILCDQDSPRAQRAPRLEPYEWSSVIRATDTGDAKETPPKDPRSGSANSPVSSTDPMKLRMVGRKKRP